MRRKLSWVGVAWRLFVALVLALCLVPIGSSPAAALDTVSVGGYFEITYEPVEFSKTEINGNEIFYATVAAEATCTNDLPLPVTEARITARVMAEHQVSGVKVTLEPIYIVTISSFPNKKGETSSESVDVSLQFPEGSQSGAYNVVGELIKAEVNISMIGWLTVTSLLPESQTMGSVTYTVPAGGVFPPPLTPTAEEVETNLFGTEASFPISSSGEILETIEATSEDGTLTLTIPEDTIALDEDGDPLSTLTVELDLDPPDPPAEAHIIGIPYKLGPPGATFSPPMIFEFTIDLTTLPPGVAVEDLVLAYYDEVAGEWVELTTTYDPATNTITASIEHFTTFAIMGKVMSAPESEPEPEVSVAVFRISELDISPNEVDIGQTVTIRALVTNTGNIEGTYLLILEIDNKVVETQEVTLAGGAGNTVTFKISENVASIYSVNINGLSDSFIVKPATTPESESTPTPPATYTPSAKPINWLLICGVVVPVVAMGVLLFFLVRRRQTKSSL